MIPHLLEDVPETLDRLAASPAVLLAFDFDGTLSPIAPTPEDARIHTEASRALERLRNANLPLVWTAVVSGRPARDLERLAPPVDFRVGLHGLEIAEGTGDPVPSGDLERVREPLDRLRSRLEVVTRLGGRVEDKGSAIAIHVRGLDESRGARALELFEEEVAVERRAGAPLECLRGKAVAEARPEWARKHLGLRSVLARLGEPALLYVGDDVTDEDVFAAHPEELTVLVAERPGPTRARTYVRDASEVAALIDRFTKAAVRRSERS